MDKPELTEIDRTELAELMTRVEQAIEHDLALSVADMKLLLSAITTLCTLQSKIEQDDITLHKLRKLLGMIEQSEKRRGASARGKGKNKGHKKPRSRKPKTGMTSSATYSHWSKMVEALVEKPNKSAKVL